MGKPTKNMRASTPLTLEAIVAALRGCGTAENGRTMKFMYRYITPP
jgi:hypothetical protein